MNISEKCSCGATFTVSDRYSSAAQEAAKSWRQDHQHADSVGICAARPPSMTVAGVEVHALHCVLKAGHSGAHRNEDDCHWIRTQPDHDLTRGNR